MRPRSVSPNEFIFMHDFIKGVLKTGKIKDLNLIFKKISLRDFSRMTGIRHHHLISRHGDWSTLNEGDKELIGNAFDLSGKEIDKIIEASKPNVPK